MIELPTRRTMPPTMSGSTLAAGSHARSEAGEATRSTGEDEAGAWPEHRAYRPAVLVHLPAAAMVFVNAVASNT